MGRLSADETHRLTTAASAALVDSVKPAYEAITAAMTEQAERASTDDGVWRSPDGADYYATLLRNYTTTELSADQIHDLGLQQVARVHQEMAALMPALHIRGTLPQLLVTMRDRKDLYYASGPSGRAMYLAETQKALDAVTAKLPQWFATLPRAAPDVFGALPVMLSWHVFVVGSEIRGCTCDRIPDHEDLDVPGGLVDAVVDMVPCLRHQEAPDDASASRGVLLTFLVGTFAELRHDGGEFFDEQPGRFLAMLLPPSALLADREARLGREPNSHGRWSSARTSSASMSSPASACAMLRSSARTSAARSSGLMASAAASYR